jgi:hypothetical protein
LTGSRGNTPYLIWNERLANHFFRPEFAGRQVYLYVTEELIAELGRDFGSDVADFVAAVDSGPEWAHAGENLCQRAYLTYEGWRERGLDRPPYIGYLGLFALAAVVEGDWAPHAYYKPLRWLLGLPLEGGALPSFRPKMLDLWDDLDVWSNRDQAGQLGVFSIRFAGEWIHVGLPKAQALLTDQERRELPSIFSEAGFIPALEASDHEITHALLRFGDGKLRARTVSLLRRQSEDNELAEALVDAVRDELDDWDGTSSATTNDAKPVVGALRLSLSLDRVARRAAFVLRCYANSAFPDDPLELAGPALSHSASCEAAVGHWSTPLRASEQIVDASQLDWAAPAALSDESAGWRFLFRAADVHLFTRGDVEGLPGFIEVAELPRMHPYVLVAKNALRNPIVSWAEEDGQRARILDFSGIPQGWFALESDGARSDGSIRDRVPILSFSTYVRILRRGGLRSGRGASYFSFGPPDILLAGATGDEQVVVEDRVLDRDSDGVYRLPDDIVAGRPRVLVEVRRGDAVVRRLALYFDEYPDWRHVVYEVRLDAFGSPIARSSAADSLLREPGPGRPSEPSAIHFPIPSDGRRIFLIGAKTGEIQVGTDQLPSWSPVWAVALGRRGDAVYVGSSADEEAPTIDDSASREQRDNWRDVMWHRRRQIRPPQERRLKTLWDSYVEAARRG